MWVIGFFARIGVDVFTRRGREITATPTDPGKPPEYHHVGPDPQDPQRQGACKPPQRKTENEMQSKKDPDRDAPLQIQNHIDEQIQQEKTGSSIDATQNGSLLSGGMEHGGFT